MHLLVRGLLAHTDVLTQYHDSSHMTYLVFTSKFYFSLTIFYFSSEIAFSFAHSSAKQLWTYRIYIQTPAPEKENPEKIGVQFDEVFRTSGSSHEI